MHPELWSLLASHHAVLPFSWWAFLRQLSGFNLLPSSMGCCLVALQSFDEEAGAFNREGG